MAFRPISMPGSFIRPPDDSMTSTAFCSSSALPTFTPLPSPRFQQAFRRDSQANVRSRKRVKLDDRRHDSGLSTPQDMSASYAESDLVTPSSAPSPAPFVNEKYHIVGGLDTPSASRAALFDRQAEDGVGWDYRSRRFRGRNEPASYFPETPFEPSGEPNFKKRHYSSSDRAGWGKLMVNLVGGVINFCWSKTFRGFAAGGGGAYDINGCTLSPVEEISWTDVQPNEDVFSSQYNGQSQDMESAPGRFPEESFIQDYMSHPESHHAMELSTPTKYDANADGDLNKWVFVGESDYRPGESSPNRASRKTPRSTEASLSKTVSRASVAGRRPKLTAHRPSPISSPAFNIDRSASYASPRSSPRSPELTPTTTSRRSKSHASFHQSPHKAASRASLATPTTPEVAEYERRIKMRDSRENAKINRANRQLQDMIREGKEALGTKVQVADVSDMEDEGYVEGAVADAAAERW